MSIKKQIQAIRDSAFQLNLKYNQVFHTEGGLRGEILKDYNDFEEVDAGQDNNSIKINDAVNSFFLQFLPTSGNTSDVIYNSHISGNFDFPAALDNNPDQNQKIEAKGISAIYGNPRQIEILSRLVASPITKYLRKYSSRNCGRDDSYFDMEIDLSEWAYIIYEIGLKVGDPNLKRCYRLVSPLDKEFLPEGENDMLVGYSDTNPIMKKCFSDNDTWEILWNAAKRQELAYSKMGTDLFLASRIALDYLLDIELPKFIKSIEANLFSFKNHDRKTKFEKVAAIAKYLQAKPTATSKEIGEATGIDDSDVRRLWRPIRKAMKEGKSALPSGYKNDGRIEGVDTSASCKYCQEPLASSFECEICNDIIIGECKTCHFTQSHPDKAVP